MTLEEKLAQLVGFWDKGDGEAVAPLQGEFAEAAGLDEATPPRAGPPHPRLRHPPGRPGRAGRGGCGSGSAAWSRETRLGIPALVHEECLTGLAAWTRRDLPDPARLGRGLRPRRSSSEMGAPIGALDARRSASTRAWRRCSTSSATRAGGGSRSASPRTRTSWAPSARPTSAGLQSAGRARHPQALRRLLRLAGRPQLRPGARGPARARRRAAGAVRDGGARRRRPLGHALLQRDRRRPGGRRPATCSPGCCATSGASTARSSPTTSGSRSCTCCTASPATSARPPRWRSPPASTSSCPRVTPTWHPLAAAVRDGRGRRGAGRPRGAARARPEGGARAARRDLRGRAAAAGRPRRRRSTAGSPPGWPRSRWCCSPTTAPSRSRGPPRWP